MIIRFISLLIRLLLRIRYRISWKGLDELAQGQKGGMLFLPNHPALVDPLILISRIYPLFNLTVLADRNQATRPLLRHLTRITGTITIPDITKVGSQGSAEIEQMLNKCILTLRNNGNLLFYPAGRLMRSNHEELGGNSAVETILNSCPDTRIVLVRITGLWGSSFSRASGNAPNLSKAIRNAIFSAISGFLFFVPKREVCIEFVIPEDFPEQNDRRQINRYLEDFYNRNVQNNTHVPYFWWQGGNAREMPEPEEIRARINVAEIPSHIRESVLAMLKEETGIEDIEFEHRLASDLGLDSLSRVRIAGIVEEQYGFVQNSPDSLETVADVMLAAWGKAPTTLYQDITPAPDGWKRKQGTGNRLTIPAGNTITEVILNRARCSRGLVMADQNGAANMKRILTGVTLIGEFVQSLEEQYVGIMLPAAQASAVSWLAVLFSGKIPVMLNWTTGPGIMHGCMEKCGVKTVLTSRKLVEKLAGTGINFGAAEKSFVYLEDLALRWGTFDKLRALLKCCLGCKHLGRTVPADTAAVLFTSGSETLPKAVPLTHANLLANVRDIARHITLTDTDCELGMLPPFHSFGLTTTILLPLALGLPVVYHPNPTESVALGKIIREYGVTVMPGTPTFLHGILRVATEKQLESLRITFTGAERCSEAVYEGLNRLCPEMKILEGYGITECSPVISANNEDNPVPCTIGVPMASLETVIVHPEALEPIPDGQTGLLLVRGPSVFNGYLNHDGKSPFVEFDNRMWYQTGDLVHRNSDGILVFDGRLKRFIKLGGEMISLPAIEAVLMRAFATGENAEKMADASASGPPLAVDWTGTDESPELVLFSTLPLDREKVNREIKTAGFSGLHNIKHVVEVPEIPVLGTGKTDYRSLKSSEIHSGGKKDV